MKRGTIDHPKMLALSDTLDVPLYSAVGILESLWHWTSRYAPRGDVGRWSNEAIAEGLRWERAHADRLIDALVAHGWLDTDSEHRLVVHGWSEHADDTVHRQLARSLQTFADGTAPNTRRLGKDDKVKAERHFRALRRVRTQGAQSAHAVRTKCALPSPSQSPSPALPEPVPSQSQCQSQGEEGLRPALAERASVGKGSPVWDAYAEAYAERYGEPPVRNAKVNGQLAQFVKRVPADEAPEIARFFVRHPAAFYAQRGHAVGLLLADAEKLRTEWATGRTTTATEARRNERTAANPFARMIGEGKP